MKTITKRELNQQTARVLAQVEAGEEVLVTERGVPRWRIEAVDADAVLLDRARATLRIRPPKANPAPWPNDDDTPADPERVDALYAESRDDR